jgi:hypothetical protein
MKMILSGVAMLGGLYWYLNGGAGGPDASRTIAKPPAHVYSEFSPLFPADDGENQGTGRDGRHHVIKIDVDKALDQSIDFRIGLDGAEVLTMRLAFEETEAGGTRISGDLDVQQALVRFAASQDGGEARHLPGFAVNIAMADMIETMAKAIEEGRPVTKDMLFPLLRLSG